MAEVKPQVKVYVPATIANFGPGFDILGAAIAGIGDYVTLTRSDSPGLRVAEIQGRDSHKLPADADRNATIVALRAALASLGDDAGYEVRFDRQIPISGGLGSSAAASVAGAFAAFAIRGEEFRRDDIIRAALEGEMSVAGKHLDNIAPCFAGGLVLVESIEKLQVHRVELSTDYWIAISKPTLDISTREGRNMLPKALETPTWTQQMAHTAALLSGLQSGNSELIRRNFIDLFAEPARSQLIPDFAKLKSAAYAAGAIGFSLSGSGPTMFALCEDEKIAHKCSEVMSDILGDHLDLAHVGRIAKEGAKVVE